MSTLTRSITPHPRCRPSRVLALRQDYCSFAGRRARRRRVVAAARAARCRDAAKIDKTRLATLTRHRHVVGACQSSLHKPSSVVDSAIGRHPSCALRFPRCAAAIQHDGILFSAPAARLRNTRQAVDHGLRSAPLNLRSTTSARDLFPWSQLNASTLAAAEYAE
jgi:hypothetical protein